MKRSVASSSTRRRSSDGWALKSKSSNVFGPWEPGESRPAGEAPLLGRADLDGEQVVQELGVTRLVALSCFERAGELHGGGGELEVGEVAA